MKVALIEVSHWHFPLYVDALKRLDVEIVGLCDKENICGERYAAEFGCPLYDSDAALLDACEVDFAFAFGRHAEMPRIGERLIACGIPFAMEKPCGISAADVATLRRLAAEKDLYVTVPFIFRLGELYQHVRETEGTLPSAFPYMAFRFIAGPPQRYLDSGLPWMLEPALSGGGCAINLSGHFIDMTRLLTGKRVTSVYARMNNLTHGTAIEDYAFLALTLEDGGVSLVETGYAFPMNAEEPREFSFTISSGNAYIRSIDGGVRTGLRAHRGGAVDERQMRLNTDGYYDDFVERAIADLRDGRPPLASLADAEAMMQIVDAGYASVKSGAPVSLV